MSVQETRNVTFNHLHIHPAMRPAIKKFNVVSCTKVYKNWILTKTVPPTYFDQNIWLTREGECQKERSRSLATTTSVVNLQSSSIRNRMCTLCVVTLGRQQGCQIGSSTFT